MASTWLLAIDLGTSNTAAACLRGGRVESIRLDSLSESMPSSVFREAGEIIVGRAAENRMRTSPGDFEPHMPGIAEWFAEHPPQDAGRS